MRLRTLAATAVAVVAVTAPASASVKPGLEGRACVRGTDATTAAARLYGPGTHAAGSSRVAGLETVLALEPFIAPGTRHRMIPLPGRFCDAEAGLNLAWKALGRRVGNGAALARAYARLAAAPYFDRTRVRSIRSAGGVHRIRTHARTNGVVAEWVVVTDGKGIRTAKWSAVKFGVPPLVGEIEGLTALVGAAERYLRAADGLLTARRGLPTSERAVPGARPLGLKYRGSDGFTFLISVGDTGATIDPGVDVGFGQADRLRDIRDMIGENYEEFLGWGFTAGWAPPVLHTPLGTAPLPNAKAGTGYVYVNGVNSLYCQACVYIADDFQIHILSHFDKALPVLGFKYPGRSTRDAMSDVIGHEMFHNFQNRYVKPTSTGRRTPGVYSEGTARTQETLHSYSKVSHQPDSLVIGDHNNVLFEGNDCKSSFTLGGFDDIPGGFIASTPYDDALAAGPFDTSLGQSYGACHFWMRFYGTYGARPFVKLITEGAALGATLGPDEEERADAEKVLRATEHATGAPFLEAQGIWLRGLITGKHMSWGPLLAGTGPVLDWGPLMDRWTPSTLAVGESVTRTLANGGVMAVKVTGATRPTVGDGARLIVLRDSDAGATLSYPDNGALVAAPAAGESVYVMAGRRAADPQETTLTLGAP
jgi:hypothetical protein